MSQTNLTSTDLLRAKLVRVQDLHATEQAARANLKAAQAELKKLPAEGKEHKEARRVAREQAQHAREILQGLLPLIQDEFGSRADTSSKFLTEQVLAAEVAIEKAVTTRAVAEAAVKVARAERDAKEIHNRVDAELDQAMRRRGGRKVS
ncbi:MAG: hypothetical protein NUV84_03765 [Candidatus Uhrbacteria bacterium]|nr:hypothetical protein [Candidatus Uhrbacteria bacterium]